MPTAHVVSEVAPTHRPWRVAAVLGLSLPILAWVISRAPLAQDLTYHNFADQRSLYGVPHFWNVASNLPFAVIGFLGCWWLVQSGRSSRRWSSEAGASRISCSSSVSFSPASAQATTMPDRPTKP